MANEQLHQPDHRSAVLAIRERKRAEAEAIGLDAEVIGRVVERFYGRVRADALLGPIFDARIDDWPAHLAKMKGFWRSVLLGTAEFSGNPMVRHQQIPGLEERHFRHWLELFYRTVQEECSQAEGAEQFSARARMIAESLLTGIELQRHGLRPATTSRRLPHA
ncbi:group III truncated hemoglobin [Erythrobacter cryptus]|uniref:group III truncated hemoglobin n=1 Tax=Erythrobacter cryptus TaxID=196588 RepID=UPI00040A2CE3|nr:group III truncated hemoglobin [Erythrobacter cryptus]GIX20268.1 MAG: hypothetical protein KatS3mg120_1944 [Erythrobacter sp.]